MTSLPQTFTVTILLHCFVVVFMTGCNQPIQEGSFYTLVFITKEIYETINFSVNKGSDFQLVSYCNVSTKVCTISSDYVQLMTYNSSSTQYISTLQIKSISRRANNWLAFGIDTYGMEHNQMTCYVPVYELPMNTSCDTPQFINNDTSISLTCRAPRVYPAPTCLFKNYSQVEINPVVSYSQIPLDDTGDVNLSCTFVWLLPTIQGPLTLTFAVTFLQLGSVKTNMQNISINLYQPEVKLGSDCLDKIRTTTETNCTCQISNPGSPPGHTQWTSSTSEKLVTFNNADGSSVLQLSARSKERTIYNCSGVSSIGLQTTPQIYSPSYIYGPNNVEISIYVPTLDEILQNKFTSINCSVQKLSVSPDVIFTLIIGDDKIDNFSLVDSNEYYKISYSFLFKSVGNIVVECQARNSEDATVQANKIIFIQQQHCSCEESKHNVIIIISVALLCVFIVAVCLAGILIGYKRKQNESAGTYDHPQNDCDPTDYYDRIINDNASSNCQAILEVTDPKAIVGKTYP